MVALYWLENFLLTYWFIKEVLPTLRAHPHQQMNDFWTTSQQPPTLPAISQYDDLQQRAFAWWHAGPSPVLLGLA